MSYGVCLPHYRTVAATDVIVETAQHAEELGFDSVWVTDHVVIPERIAPMFGEVFYDPFVTLSYVAARTNRVRLGTTCIILPYRNPIAVAKMVSSLDNLSGGRVIFGVAAGWVEAEFQALGAPYQERGAITDEFLRVILELWTNPEPRFEGRHYSFSGIKFQPRPLQKPRPPIWVGGNSRRAILRAVEFGDCWHPTFLTLDDMEERIAYLREASATEGRIEPLSVAVRATLGFEAAEAVGAYSRPLSGTPEKIAADIRAYQAAGVTDFLFDLAGETIEDFQRTMEVFADKVRPLVAQ
jgi:probable F420-dependent oxidoreductase